MARLTTGRRSSGPALGTKSALGQSLFLNHRKEAMVNLKNFAKKIGKTIPCSCQESKADSKAHTVHIYTHRQNGTYPDHLLTPETVSSLADLVSQ